MSGVKRMVVSLLGLGLVLDSLVGRRALQAQRAEFSRKWGVGAGAGVSVPVGSSSVTDSPGAHALMYFSYSFGPAVGVGLDVGATRMPHKVRGHTDLDEVLVGAVWRPGRRGVVPVTVGFATLAP